MTNPPYDIVKPEEFFSELKKQYDNFFATYQKLRFYIPPYARQNFSEYSTDIMKFIIQKDLKQRVAFSIELRKRETEITDLLQKFIGL